MQVPHLFDIVIFMKKLGKVIGLIIIGSMIFYLLIDHLLLFVMTGLVPFTNIVISPTLMLFFWLLIVPVCVLSWKIFDISLWRVIENVGKVHQRSLNRKFRAFMPSLSSSTVCLIALTILYQTDKSSADNNVILRRRFAPLPS